MKTLLMSAAFLVMTAEEKEEFCQAVGELGKSWAYARDSGLTEIEMEMQTIDLMEIGEAEAISIYNKMLLDLVRNIFSYPYPDHFDAEVESIIICEDVIKAN